MIDQFAKRKEILGLANLRNNQLIAKFIFLNIYLIKYYVYYIARQISALYNKIATYFDPGIELSLEY